MASQRSAFASGLSLSSSQTLQHAAAIGIAVIAVVARAYVSWRTHLTADDALTTLRYAENLATGRGFVYNPGEHVLGVTGPLYAMILSVFSPFSFSPTHLNTMLVGKACNIAGDGVTCFLLARLLARTEVGRPVEGLFAAALYALSGTPIIVSISGTETGLATCVGLAMVYAYIARRPYWLYTLGAVLFLLSINGLLLFAILAAALALRERELPSRAGAIALIITIPWLIFATAYFGSPIPRQITNALPGTSTVYGQALAATAGNNSLWANLPGLSAQFVSDWFQCGLSLLFALGAILVACQAVRRAERGVMAAPLVWCLIYFGLILFSRNPTSPWYFVPAWPVFIAIACLAGATAPIKLGKLRPDLAVKWSSRAVPGALTVLILIGIAHLRSITFELSASQRISNSTRYGPGSGPSFPQADTDTIYHTRK